jgi:pyridoxamine 5'-phosphate oxidase
MRFIGIDLAWERGNSGLARLDWDGTSLKLRELELLDDLKKILRWVEERGGENAVVAIDAPTVIPNRAGMREADRLTHERYGKYDAGCYPASRARTYWRRTTAFSKALERAGFAHGDQMPTRANGRWQIEVYPHAAAVQLFALRRILKYKRGTVAERAKALAELRMLVQERLPLATPRLAPPELPDIPHNGRALKQTEDELDALLCAYVAAYWWYWGPARNDVLGDSARGYIVVPHRRTPAVPLADLRESYLLTGLDETAMAEDAITQFEEWFEQARAAGIREPNAMTLATATAAAEPSARIVLLKGLDDRGFVFYTNYDSQKGRELAENPRAALVFYWPELERQVRVSGAVSRVSREASEAYFRSRPIGHQLGAWASKQSTVVDGRAALEAALEQARARFAGKEVLLPENWGGYRLEAEMIEFWQGRPDRLHDRIRYRFSGGAWLRERLSP